jgi:hypothetical protein
MHAISGWNLDESKILNCIGNDLQPEKPMWCCFDPLRALFAFEAFHAIGTLHERESIEKVQVGNPKSPTRVYGENPARDSKNKPKAIAASCHEVKLLA